MYGLVKRYASTLYYVYRTIDIMMYIYWHNTCYKVLIEMYIG